MRPAPYVAEALSISVPKGFTQNMHTKLIRGALVATGLGLTATALAVSPAHATTVTQVRSADLVTSLNDVRSAGHYDFLAEGVHVRTDDASSQAKVALYFPMTGELPTSGSIEWYGTDIQPGSQIVFDKDQTTGNNNDYNVLVGEQVYSTNAAGKPLTDWWYTGGTAKAATNGITCPSTTGGSGSDCHGTLAQWAAALTAERVYAGGFSLGSGAKGDGVVRAVNFGETSYTFTSTAKTRVDVTATAKRTSVKKGKSVVINGTATPAGPGAKVTLQLKAKDGTWKAVQTQDLAASGAYELKAKAGKAGNAKYRVTVSESNTTAAATSNKVKVLIVKK
jgi:hypothetical protein